MIGCLLYVPTSLFLCIICYVGLHLVLAKRPRSDVMLDYSYICIYSKGTIDRHIIYSPLKIDTYVIILTFICKDVYPHLHIHVCNWNRISQNFAYPDYFQKTQFSILFYLFKIQISFITTNWLLTCSLKVPISKQAKSLVQLDSRSASTNCVILSLVLSFHL